MPPKLKNKRVRRPYACRALDIDALAPALHKVMAIGGGERPLVVLGWYDAARRCRRMRATYPNGWQLTIRINPKGQVTSSQASFKVTAAK